LVTLSLAIALIVATNLAAQGGAKGLLLQFVPKEEQHSFFVPQEEPTVSSAAAVEAALSGGALWTDSAAVAEVVLVHLSDPNVDPPYDDRLAWVVNFNPNALSGAATMAGQPEFEPLQFQYVLIDAHTGEFIFGAGGGGQPIGSW
jgi:hypothetical protein